MESKEKILLSYFSTHLHLDIFISYDDTLRAVVERYPIVCNQLRRAQKATITLTWETHRHKPYQTKDSR